MGNKETACVANESRLVGCVFGLAVGDAVGFVVEGNPADVCVQHFRSISKWAFGSAAEPKFESYFPFGQVTDDTQIAMLLLEAALEEGNLAENFARKLVSLQGKFVGLGMATTKSITRLVRGVSEKESGSPEGMFVPSEFVGPILLSGEAGNGPAVRASVLGCVLPEKALLLACEEQSLVTHRDKRCVAGAVVMSFAVKKLVGLQKPLDVAEFVGFLSNAVRGVDVEFRFLSPFLFWFCHFLCSEWIEKLPELLSLSVGDAAKIVSRFGVANDYNDGSVGITGFVVSSVLWALFSFLRTPNSFWSSQETCISGGGDTDSTCAMTGALSGSFNGCTGIPVVVAEKIHDQERKDLYAEIVKLVSNSPMVFLKKMTETAL